MKEEASGSDRQESVDHTRGEEDEVMEEASGRQESGDHEQGEEDDNEATAEKVGGRQKSRDHMRREEDEEVMVQRVSGGQKSGDHLRGEEGEEERRSSVGTRDAPVPVAVARGAWGPQRAAQAEMRYEDCDEFDQVDPELRRLVARAESLRAKIADLKARMREQQQHQQQQQRSGYLA
eukprot:m51a1_g12709 hypothetical protein (178) ;mRNA; f:23-556